jgi:hypothetical protein
MSFHGRQLCIVSYSGIISLMNINMMNGCVQIECWTSPFKSYSMERINEIEEIDKIKQVIITIFIPSILSSDNSNNSLSYILTRSAFFPYKTKKGRKCVLRLYYAIKSLLTFYILWRLTVRYVRTTKKCEFRYRNIYLLMLC